jgi:hypothetical protein
MRSLRHRLLSVFFLAIFLVTVLTPDKVSAHLFQSGSWIRSSLHANSMMGMAGILAQGIGGLQVNIDSVRNLSVSNLSYNNGRLYANIENKPVNVEVNPKIVHEAIRVMEHTDKHVFQVSLDSTAVGNIRYIDEALKDTTIGELLFDADLDFASVVDGSESEYLLDSQMYPYNKGLDLLDNHDDYRKLPDKWINPPVSWSQIYFHFNPMVPGLVQLEFNPQIFFITASGHPVEVSKEIEELGKLPYEPLKEDVRNNPLTYINNVPALKRAASITATLGLVAAGCQKPASCLNLKHQAWISSILTHLSNERKEKEGNANQLRIEQVQKARMDFMNQWDEYSFQKFDHVNNSDITWADAYDAVQRGAKTLSQEDLTDSLLSYMKVLLKPEELKKVTESISNNERIRIENSLSERARELSKQKFLNNSVPPNDSLLMAASAVTSAWDGDTKAAQEKLDLAIKFSNNYPGTRFQVIKMGYFVGQIIKKEKKSMGEEIDLRMQFEQRKAKVKAYDEIDHCLDHYLKGYEKKSLLICIPEYKDKQTKDLRIDTLRILETYARDSGLYKYVPRRDLAWLHGRFAYLIGNEINDLTQKKDRLRFLSAYTQEAQPGWHRWKLHQLENKMRISLGMKPHPTDWRSLISGLAIGVAILDLVRQSLKKGVA